MLEAISPVLQNAQTVRAVVESTAASESLVANPERAQRVAPRAPYVSPYIFMDVNFDKAVLQIRDSDTGDVLKQFPSESKLEAVSREVTGESRVEVAPRAQEDSAQALVQSAGPGENKEAVTTASANASAVVQQQIAAFAAAAQAGNSNAGAVTVFA